MSKEIQWGVYHGEGNIVCTCDNCGFEHEVDFDGGAPDFREAQAEIRSIGWQSIKIDGEWYDFCCEKCRNEYIKNNS